MSSESDRLALRVPSEDRGTPFWIWRDGRWASFWKMPGAIEKCEVSVPIGWHLKPDPDLGVVLVNVYGFSMNAMSVLYAAEGCRQGFRFRLREFIP